MNCRALTSSPEQRPDANLMRFRPIARRVKLAETGCMRLTEVLKSGFLLFTASAVFVLAGCGSLGPKTLDKDQLSYGNSVGDNWKNQLLANLVKLRYLDMPVFVDVGQIVSGYTVEAQVSGQIGFGDEADDGILLVNGRKPQKLI